MTMAWFHVQDSLWSSLRKVAGLSCPQYRGAEILCQETASEPLFPSKASVTCGTLVKFQKAVKCPYISGKMAGIWLTFEAAGDRFRGTYLIRGGPVETDI